MHIHSFFKYLYTLFIQNIFFLSWNSVDHRVSNSSSSLLYSLANATYYTCKTVIATEILPLENYELVLWLFFFFGNRKYPFLYTLLFCIHYLFRGIFKNVEMLFRSGFSQALNYLNQEYNHFKYNLRT